MKWALLFDFELSILPLLFILLQSPAVPANLSANKEMLTETYVKSTTESLTQQQFSQQRFLEDVSRMWITMTPRSRRCFFKHTENMSITPSEKACLLVSRRRPCPKDWGQPVVERTGRPVVERGQELKP